MNQAVVTPGSPPGDMLPVVESFLRDQVRDAIHLVSIEPDGPGLDGRYFGEDAAEAAKWAIAENSRPRNIYWTVNKIGPGCGKKPKKSDIVAARFVHADVDPPKSGGFDRGSKLLQLDLLACPPSLIIDSGNGLQPLWRLDSETADWRTIEDISRGAESVLEADHCHNIDRLLRVPGTVNYPNKIKRAAGRVPVLATSVSACEGAAYPVEALAKMFPPIQADKKDSEKVALDPFELITADDLALPNHELIRAAIEHPKGEDRSADGFHCACLMLHAGAAPEQVAGILLNPENAVSGHYLSQAYPDRAARRVIERAWEKVKPGFPAIEPEPSDPAALAPTPWRWVDPRAIPPRAFLYGKHYIRKFVSAGFGAPGGGKSSKRIAEAVAMASGRPLLGVTPVQKLKVWYWNGEDPAEETTRRVAALCLHYGIDLGELEGFLFTDSGRDMPIIIAEQDRTGTKIAVPVVEGLKAGIKAAGIDVLILDPFVSCHRVAENDNAAIDAVVKKFADIANATECSVNLEHHLRKTNGSEATVEDGRGAISLVGAARSVEVLNKMTAAEAARLGVEQNWRYFSVDHGKANMSPLRDREWFKLESVFLDNGNALHAGDNVGVATKWAPPSLTEGITDSDFDRCSAAIKGGEWREDSRAQDWIGKPIAATLGLDLTSPAARMKTRAVVDSWIEEGKLALVQGVDDRRRPRSFVEIAEKAAIS